MKLSLVTEETHRDEKHLMLGSAGKKIGGHLMAEVLNMVQYQLLQWLDSAARQHKCPGC